MKEKVTTVKELKEILNRLPDWAEVEYSGITDEVKKGVEVIYCEGTSWLSPYICFIL